MGRCIYCNFSAGLFNKQHAVCAKNYEEAKTSVASFFLEQYRRKDKGKTVQQPSSYIDEICINFRINDALKYFLGISGWETVAKEMLDQNEQITVDDEIYLRDLQNSLSLMDNDLDIHGTKTDLLEYCVIQDLSNGEILESVEIPEGLFFNLQKSESLVWIIESVEYFEETFGTKRVGNTRKGRIKITKELSVYIPGTTKRSARTSYLAYIDTGTVGVTTRHVYFVGSSKTFRIEYGEIARMEKYTDGIGIHRYIQNAEEQVFVCERADFISKLVRGMVQRYDEY